MTKSLLKRENKDVLRTRDTLTPFDEMDRMFDLFSRGWMQPFAYNRPWFSELSNIDTTFPRFDVIDRDKEIVVRAEIPGVEKDDLEVTLTDNMLTISGKTFSEEKEEEGDFFRSEIRQGKFSRSVTLPHDVNADKVVTRFKDGLLTLTMPKLEVARRRHISIS